MTQITVGDIARRIMEPDEDFEVVRDRLRTWVKAGLLQADEKNPGTGLHRQFSERSIVEAAILARLAKHYDMGTKAGPLVRRALDLAFRKLPGIKPTKEQILYFFAGTTGVGRDSKPLVNIQLVDPPAKASQQWRLKIPPNADDAVLINLNRLFQRVGVPLEAFTGGSRG